MIMRILFFSLFIALFKIARASQCLQRDLSEEDLTNLSETCFHQKYNPKIHDGQKLSKIINQKLMAYKRILRRIKMDQIQHTKTTPVLKWAQSIDKIFINFKLSHRHDSPPCSEITFEEFNVLNIPEAEGQFQIQKDEKLDTNQSFFYFLGQCSLTDQKFLFNFTLTFNTSINKVTVYREGFGSYTIIGEKSQHQVWIDPFENVQRAAIWPEMREKYSKEMDTYFELRQKRLQELQSQKPRKKGKKRRPKNTEKEEGNEKKDQPKQEDL